MIIFAQIMLSMISFLHFIIVLALIVKTLSSGPTWSRGGWVAGQFRLLYSKSGAHQVF